MNSGEEYCFDQVTLDSDSKTMNSFSIISDYE